eukprot:scaffold19642_cov60-Phaeocystis_antarctica.AAC.2
MDVVKAIEVRHSYLVITPTPRAAWTSSRPSRRPKPAFTLALTLTTTLNPTSHPTPNPPPGRRLPVGQDLQARRHRRLRPALVEWRPTKAVEHAVSCGACTASARWLDAGLIRDPALSAARCRARDSCAVRGRVSFVAAPSSCDVGSLSKYRFSPCVGPPSPPKMTTFAIKGAKIIFGRPAKLRPKLRDTEVLRHLRATHREIPGTQEAAQA